MWRGRTEEKSSVTQEELSLILITQVEKCDMEKAHAYNPRAGESESGVPMALWPVSQPCLLDKVHVSKILKGICNGCCFLAFQCMHIPQTCIHAFTGLYMPYTNKSKGETQTISRIYQYLLTMFPIFFLLD